MFRPRTTVAEAVGWCRGRRAPVLLHLDTVRLWGHAGSDVEQHYRTADRVSSEQYALRPAQYFDRSNVERIDQRPIWIAIGNAVDHDHDGTGNRLRLEFRRGG